MRQFILNLFGIKTREQKEILRKRYEGMRLRAEKAFGIGNKND